MLIGKSRGLSFIRESMRPATISPDGILEISGAARVASKSEMCLPCQRSRSAMSADMAERERWQSTHISHFEATLDAPEISRMPSGEMVAGLIDSRMNDKPRDFPINIANAGQVPDLPDDVVVESMCTVD